MKRFLFLILAVLLCGCEPYTENQPDVDKQQDIENPLLNELDVKLSNYQFHDDFYYEPYLDDGKYSLAPCLSEHFIRFTTEYQDEVIAELLDRGFQIAKGPVQVNYSSEEFEIPEGVRYGSKMSVKGEGKIDDIPHVIYSNHIYYSSEYNAVVADFGRSDLLWVYYDIENAESQVELLMRYAEKFKIYPLKHYRNYGRIEFVCTNLSSGNPVELANCFVEVGGFPDARPDQGYESQPNHTK